MDMNKILQNFEDAAKGEYAPSKQESSDMRTILESFNKVAADDTNPQQLDEIASVSISGETADEVAQLVKLLNDAGAPEAAPVGAQPTTMHEPSPCGGPPDMPSKDTMITPKMMDDFEFAEEPVEEGRAKQILTRKAEMMAREDFVADAGEMGMTAEEAGEFWDAVNGETESYANEPDERYDDHETMTLDLSGGINRRKNSYKRAEPGDNPIAAESSLREQLSKMLKKKMSEKKDQDGDGKNDFDDVQIARMKASGMNHDDAVAKVKGGKKSKKESDEEVDEAAPKNNPVAKHAGKFNKAQIQTDKKKEMKKGKGVKHKGKDFAMESAPVFNRYVKPLLDKSPKQIIELYDTEAYDIIDRLSRESRALAKQNLNTRVHDCIVGKLRENLSVLPETKLDEMRSRRSS